MKILLNLIDKKLQSASAICSTFPPCGAGNILKTEDIMQAYDTLSETMEALRKEGYVEDFNLGQDALVCRQGENARRGYAPGIPRVREFPLVKGGAFP